MGKIPVQFGDKPRKKIPVYSWNQIPDSEKTLKNEDWFYIVEEEIRGGGLNGYTYLLNFVTEDRTNVYIGKWYR